MDIVVSPFCCAGDKPPALGGIPAPPPIGLGMHVQKDGDGRQRHKTTLGTVAATIDALALLKKSPVLSSTLFKAILAMVTLADAPLSIAFVSKVHQF